MRRRTRFGIAVLFAAMVLALGFTRMTGVVLQAADGRTLGYSSATGEWLALQYPDHPAGIDGPYLRERDGERELLRVARGDDGAIALVRDALPPDAKDIEVEIDGDTRRSFRVRLRGRHERGPVDWPMPARLFVASDFEGQFDAFVALMQANGVLDQELHWRFGDGRLVLVGDLVDRGPNVLPLLWLVYRMEAEAQAAAGGVHYVLGNHEQMLITGDTRYLHPKYFGTLNLVREAPTSLWDEHTELGRWLRSKPVLLKVGDFLFLHGGVSPSLLARDVDLARVDRAAAAAIAAPIDAIADDTDRQLIRERDGVLWYRGLATANGPEPKADAVHVSAVLRHFDVRHVAIGHSLAEQVGSDYDGAVLRIDVDHASGTVEGLLVDEGRMFRVDVHGERHALEPARNLD